jgi:hypothetical protein
MEQKEQYEVKASYDPKGGKYNTVITVVEVASQRIVDSFEFSAHNEEHALYVATQERSARNQGTKKDQPNS